MAQTVAVGVALSAGWVVVTDTVVAGSEGLILGLVGALVLFTVVGFYEELVARGFILKNVAEGFARYGTAPAVIAAVIISSVVFGIVHLANAGASLVSVVVIAVIAITVAASYVLTGRLGLAIGFHTSWNIAMGVLFGQPVSGIELPAHILALEVTGPTRLDWRVLWFRSRNFGCGCRLCRTRRRHCVRLRRRGTSPHTSQPTRSNPSRPS
ncbi:CPBP family intramembrane glutamic endopeptidase [Halomicroarcula sp. GCM10025710]